LQYSILAGRAPFELSALGKASARPAAEKTIAKIAVGNANRMLLTFII
jgi:hypothetical protein